ncbi:hypothetical protein M231_05134 [Tremella mesenterica]|uniref:Uncharacterized protein n=1 Tax=Tremella mesenterica TaxID=5217 RepID=A0A4Q1BJ18_TREME|nr:hypothetical protein M231_05134 [Tremella mesenterica]
MSTDIQELTDAAAEWMCLVAESMYLETYPGMTDHKDDWTMGELGKPNGNPDEIIQVRPFEEEIQAAKGKLDTLYSTADWSARARTKEYLNRTHQLMHRKRNDEKKFFNFVIKLAGDNGILLQKLDQDDASLNSPGDGLWTGKTSTGNDGSQAQVTEPDVEPTDSQNDDERRQWLLGILNEGQIDGEGEDERQNESA